MTSHSHTALAPAPEILPPGWSCCHGGWRRTSRVRLDDQLGVDAEAIARAEGTSLNETVKLALREAVERRGRDPKFKARLRQIIEEEDRELLERLAE